MKIHRRGGFTIVELLIVIVVIGILAAITLIAFNGISGKATISAVKTDVQQAGILIRNDAVTGNGYPTTVAAANNGQGLKGSYGASEFSLHTDNTEGQGVFCLTATTGTTSYYVTNVNSAPIQGVCPPLIYEAANNTNPIAVLSGASGSTGITDANAASGLTFYFLNTNAKCNSPGLGFSLTTVVTVYCNPGGSGWYRYDSTNGYFQAPSSQPTVPQANIEVPSGGPAVATYVQTSTSSILRLPGNYQQTISNGRTLTAANAGTYSTTGGAFDRVWIYAGVHSQATSEAIMQAITADWTMGGNGLPVAVGLAPSNVDSCDTSPPWNLISGAAYGSSTTTYQWQSSPNNTTWNDIAGATSTTYPASYGGPYYRLKMSNSYGTSYSGVEYIYNGGCG